MDKPKLNDNKLDFIESLITIFNNTLTSIYRTLNTIVNGSNFTYYISIIFIILFILILNLLYFINPYDIFSNKISQMILLLSGSIFLIIFYFFSYRNKYDKYSKNDKDIINETKSEKVLKYPGTINLLLKNNQKPSKKQYFENLFNSFKSDISGNINYLLAETNDSLYLNNENIKTTIGTPIYTLLKKLIITILIILIPILILYYIFWLTIKYENSFYLIKLLVFLIIIIITLSIFAEIFKISNDDDCFHANNTYIGTFLCIIKKLIFFIPCLILIIISNVKEELKITPPTIFIILIIEILLICFLFLLPIIFKEISNLNKNDLLKGKGPYYTNKKYILDDYQSLNLENTKAQTKKLLFNRDSQYNINIINNPNKLKYDYNYNYSISFYIYLNPQGTNTNIAYNQKTNLFNYGYKPAFSYDGRSRSLIVESKTKNSENSDDLEIIFKTNNFKYQKWLYVVINYQNNVIDVFIDGKLVGSKKNVAPFFEDDKVIIGENDGIHGSIKDVYYFNKPRPKNNIEFLYDLTKN